jgi:hypothetical protein
VPRIKYKNFKFKAASLEIIGRANVILTEMAAGGFILTLRQL